jgi:flagellar motor switch protein FliM
MTWTEVRSFRNAPAPDRDGCFYRSIAIWLTWTDRLYGGSGSGPFPSRGLTALERSGLMLPWLEVLHALGDVVSGGLRCSPRISAGPMNVDYGTGSPPDASRVYARFAIDFAGSGGI